jgi:hypothetical protein
VNEPSEVSSVLELLSGRLVAQSYDFKCMEPKRILLKTVIPGWLWRGMTADFGKQNIPNCIEHAEASVQQLWRGNATRSHTKFGRITENLEQS